MNIDTRYWSANFFFFFLPLCVGLGFFLFFLFPESHTAQIPETIRTDEKSRTDCRVIRHLIAQAIPLMVSKWFSFFFLLYIYRERKAKVHGWRK